MCCSICNSDPTGAHELRVTGLRFHGPRAQGSMAPGQDPPAHFSPGKLHRFQFCPKLGPLNQYSTQNNHRGATTLNHTSNHTSNTAHPQSDALPSRQSTYVQKLQLHRLINCLPNSAINNIRFEGHPNRLYLGFRELTDHINPGTKATDLRPHSRSADQRTRYDSHHIDRRYSPQQVYSQLCDQHSSYLSSTGLSLLFRDQNQQPLKARNSRTFISFPRSKPTPVQGAVSRSVSHTFLNIPLVEGYEFNPSSCQILIGGLFVSAIDCGLFKASLSQFLLHIIGSTTVHRFYPTSALLVPQSNRLNFGFRDQVRRLLQTAPLIWQSTLV
ncbi:hypothetical protein PGT21_000088 [Puccinia graminis f. sp. tritici]|uniref:Uncharacterized protein n=1 Tax=Puccinia graminis f. sp. tritici TaxID=56615 RepID=A0A5B0LZI9_PUCGR|nr:hypothetical protein PGT21_000088 [Puccinia graminis f. sp. tritici]